MTWISKTEDLILSNLGESAILCQFPEGTLDFDRQRRIWAIADLAVALPSVKEVIPGMNNLVVIYDPFVVSNSAMSEMLSAIWAKAKFKDCGGSVLEVPVVYGGQTGEDLPEISARAGLTPEEFVSLHTSGDYVVYALGSQPGFAYLGGLDPRLTTPRRSTPRPRVEAGTVMIGGEQTAVLSKTTPSGWNLIGKTELEFFDASKSIPALLSPGHRLRFIVKDIIL
jgi:KipI family sensor histidine kinase inhibitor